MLGTGYITEKTKGEMRLITHCGTIGMWSGIVPMSEDLYRLVMIECLIFMFSEFRKQFYAYVYKHYSNMAAYTGK